MVGKKVVKQVFELDVWITNGSDNLAAFEELLGSYDYISYGASIVTQRANDTRYSFDVVYYGSDDLEALEWLGDFYQVKNQFKGVQL